MITVTKEELRFITSALTTASLIESGELEADYDGEIGEALSLVNELNKAVGGAS